MTGLLSVIPGGKGFCHTHHWFISRIRGLLLHSKNLLVLSSLAQTDSPSTGIRFQLVPGEGILHRAPIHSVLTPQISQHLNSETSYTVDTPSCGHAYFHSKCISSSLFFHEIARNPQEFTVSMESIFHHSSFTYKL